MIVRRVIRHFGDVNATRPGHDSLWADERSGASRHALEASESTGVGAAEADKELVVVRVIDDCRIAMVGHRCDPKIAADRLTVETDPLAGNPGSERLPHDEEFFACCRVGDVSHRLPP